MVTWMLRAEAHFVITGTFISNRMRTIEAIRSARSILDNSFSFLSSCSCNLWLQSSIKNCTRFARQGKLVTKSSHKSQRHNREHWRAIKCLGKHHFTSTNAASLCWKLPTIDGDSPTSLAPATSAASIQPNLRCTLPQAPFL